MRRLHVSILRMMIAIAFLAVWFAALRSGSDLWFSTVYTLTIAALLVATLAARFRRGNEGAFWFGFAVFGWGFFVLDFGAALHSSGGFSGGGFRDKVNQDLLTSKAIAIVIPYLRSQPDGFKVIDEFLANTIRVAHLMLTLVIAVIGGLIAFALRRRRRKPTCLDGSNAPRRSWSRFFAILFGLVLIPLIGLPTYFSRPGEPYFPDLAFHQDKERNEFNVEWYTKHLRAMREPSLWKLSRSDRKATVYRFLWLHSFDHPVCVRLVKAGDRIVMHALVLDGLGGYEPGDVVINKQVILSIEQWNRLGHFLDKAEFWAMPTEDEDGGGSDGAQLIVEAVKDGQYHLVDRWSPESGPYLVLCQFMLDLSGLGARSLD
jgi:hypothetical protein